LITSQTTIETFITPLFNLLNSDLYARPIRIQTKIFLLNEMA
jgi:hypothetical protein